MLVFYASTSGRNSQVKQRLYKNTNKKPLRRHCGMRHRNAGNLNYAEAYLFPRRVNRLANHECGICPGSWSEFLRATAIDFGNIEIALLVDAESVHPPKPARKIPPGSPRIKEMSFEIILQHLRSSAIERPKCAVGPNVKQMDIRRLRARTPLI